MTQDDFLIGFRQIEKEAEDKKTQLRKDYVKETNPYQIGDVISDHYKTIRIEGISGITTYSGTIIPYPIYRGVVLKKDGNPAKNQTDNLIYASNIEGYGNDN